jgi:hypothetical protein
MAIQFWIGILASYKNIQFTFSKMKYNTIIQFRRAGERDG